MSKCVFRLYAGSAAGTGVLVGLGHDPQSGVCFATLATAWHVLKALPGTTDELEIVSADRKTVFSSAANQIGFYPLGEARYDTGLIVLRTGRPLAKESELLPLFPHDSVLGRGADIGWLGFPGIAEPELCFFHGHISGYLNDPPTYLVDGVAINGVSGGPAFDNRVHVIGLVSAYVPNRVDSSTTLPGLMTLVPINAIRYWMEHRLGARVLKKTDLTS
ncbi:MAG: trypsin-like peptidase domain-containing protein [candidate division NC10 bacterium]|nr:trypsin-like peptidase domain-containing protein [candidate division NC10 bacterium]